MTNRRLNDIVACLEDPAEGAATAMLVKIHHCWLTAYALRFNILPCFFI